MTFFSAANPAIPFGGMLDESKEAIDHLIPAIYRPKTVVYDPLTDLINQLQTAGLTYPIIIKPDIGLKGHHVYKVSGHTHARELLESLDMGRQWLLQEYINYDKEYALLIAKWPDTQKTEVLSLIEKKYPTVTGDGTTSLKDLILNHPHPYLCKETVLNRWKDKWTWVPDVDVSVTVHSIGNYGKGASFHSLMRHIDTKFCQDCAEAVEGFGQLYFYRMDLKANDQAAIAAGNFKVIEINGAKSEPLHIYDKCHSFWQNAKDIKRHWQILSTISELNTAGGFELPSFTDGMSALRSVREMLAS
jgi:hypothetical protein